MRHLLLAVADRAPPAFRFEIVLDIVAYSRAMDVPELAYELVPGHWAAAGT
jgi:hypothetical protein